MTVILILYKIIRIKDLGLVKKAGFSSWISFSCE